MITTRERVRPGLDYDQFHNNHQYSIEQANPDKHTSYGILKSLISVRRWVRNAGKKRNVLLLEERANPMRISYLCGNCSTNCLYRGPHTGRLL